MTTEDRFEERLLTQLRAHVAGRDAGPPTPAPAATAWRARGPRLALAGAAAAAVIAGVAIASGGDGAEPAYAVEPQDDGSVSVTIRSMADADGLERALRDAGVNAEVEALPAGTSCPSPRVQRAPDPGSGTGTGPSVSSVRQAGDGTTEFTIAGPQVARGETVVITTVGDPGEGGTISLAFGRGAAGACG